MQTMTYYHCVDTSADSSILCQLILTASLVLMLLVRG